MRDYFGSCGHQSTRRKPGDMLTHAVRRSAPAAFTLPPGLTGTATDPQDRASIRTGDLMPTGSDVTFAG
jgi:hypothetical protein